MDVVRFTLEAGCQLGFDTAQRKIGEAAVPMLHRTVHAAAGRHAADIKRPIKQASDLHQ
jgi:hypothetical protein